MGIEEVIDFFVESWKSILPLTFSFWIAMPFIKTGVWQLIYFFLKTEWALNKLAEVTFTDGIIPYYFALLINPIHEIIKLFLLCILVTLFLYWRENRNS